MSAPNIEQSGLMDASTLVIPRSEATRDLAAVRSQPPALDKIPPRCARRNDGSGACQALLVALACCIVVSPATRAADSDVQRLKLRPYATIYGDTVRLGDVLLLTDVDEQVVTRIESAPIFPAQHGFKSVTVTHEQIVTRLDELGVNLARVLISGATSCRVKLEAEATPEASGTNEAPLLRERRETSTSGHTLRTLLTNYARNELHQLGGDVELRFERGGEELLELTNPPWDFRINATGSSKLGLREFRVVLRRDGHVQRTAHVYADVRLTREVVVAKRPLSIGNHIRRNDVHLEKRVFNDDSRIGLTSLDEAIGQQVKDFVPKDEMLTPSDVKNVDLVQRSRPVTVVGDNGGVQLRLSGVALDAGSYGDTVRVRLGDRKHRQTLRGIVSGLGTVRLQEGEL